MYLPVVLFCCALALGPGCSRSQDAAAPAASEEALPPEPWVRAWQVLAAEGEVVTDLDPAYVPGTMPPEDHPQRPAYDPDQPRRGILVLRPDRQGAATLLRFDGPIPEEAAFLAVEACGDYRDDSVLLCTVNGRPVGVNRVPGEGWSTLRFPLEGYLAESNVLELVATAGGKSAEGPNDCYIDRIYFDDGTL